MRYEVTAVMCSGTSTFEIEANGMVDARRRAKEELRRNFTHFQINSIRPVGTLIKEGKRW